MYKESQLIHKFFLIGMVVACIALLYILVIQISFARIIGGNISSLWISIILLVLIVSAFLNAYRMTITVDENYLTVRFGLLKKRIPLKEINSCKPVKHNWGKWWQCGVRKEKGGAYLYLTRGDKGIEVKTKEERCIISTGKAEEICSLLKKPRTKEKKRKS
jgi:hypothetical protein